MRLTPTTQQRRAIEAPMGPVLVVAGPGAGKTACLIGRIAQLIGTGLVPAERICAVTFTNKAAEEIALRLAESLGHAADGARKGTIHALCADILREHAAAAGLRPGFGIADEDYQLTLLRQMGQGRRNRQLLGLFGRRRLQHYRLTPGDEELFREYQTRLRRRNLVDFDDLVVLTAELFAARPEIASAVAGRWSYLLVDEFQDINEAQYDVLRALAAPHRNFFAVGDDEQSIFSWTGADPHILRRFQQDYQVPAAIILDKNHRTTEQIFNVARTLLAENPSLFDKDLSATRQSPFAVQALAFDDDEAETAWILADIADDLRRHNAEHPEEPLDWGDYAVLYRRHESGDLLESRFVRAGVPCRLAKGRALTDDKAIGFVVATLRLVLDPADVAAAEQFARRVLPGELSERLQAAARADEPFVLTIRDLAGMMGRDPAAKLLWRLYYRLENLASMGKRHTRLDALVEELLAEGVGEYRNPLEDRHEDLSDPAAHPAAAALADRLEAARRTHARIVLDPMGGLEIALRGMLFGAGFRLVLYAGEVEQAELDDLRIGPDAGGADGLAFVLFKALQLLHTRGLEAVMPDYVTFDLETTDLDTAHCEIVEIGAVKVHTGRVVERFASLVRPGRPISAGARAAHGIADADVAAAPNFAEVWPRFRAFVGPHTLVAHNAQDFDMPVLRRLAAGAADDLVVYDTLPLARSLVTGSAKLEAMAQAYGIDPGRSHRAPDDAATLVGVYQKLEELRLLRARKTALANLLPYLGLALVLDSRRPKTDEVEWLLKKASDRALGRFSDCLEYYEAERERSGLHGPSIEEVIERLGGRRRMERLREDRAASDRYPESVARLQPLLEQQDSEPLDSAVRSFLERVTLSSARAGADISPHRVSLLTLHSTKGLEFSRVYVVGVEDEQLPGFINRESDETQQIQEARRLLYVGMTRAEERLVLTRADRRAGRPGGRSQFLEEMQLGIVRPGEAPQLAE